MFRISSKHKQDSTPGESAAAEKELVLRSARGDKDAYRILVERYQQRVFAVAFEVVRNRADAEDIAQESFVKAYLALPGFKGESSFFTWLYRIAHHMALDVRRKIVRHGSESFDNEEQQPSGLQQATHPDPQQAALNREAAGRIASALRQISEEHRSVVMLREVDGLSYEEIAKVTGVSRGTVMSRLFYARRKLQEALREFAPIGDS